jgi:hypothetical protein
MTTNNSPPIALIINIFQDKIKKNNISSSKIHNYWKSAKNEAILIMKAKEIIKDAPHCIIINNGINNFYYLINNCINVIFTIFLIYFILYIYFFIGFLCKRFY